MIRNAIKSFVISLCLVVCLFIPILRTDAYGLSNDEITSRITALQSTYPNNSYSADDQCWGFARTVARQLFGSSPSHDFGGFSHGYVDGNGWTYLSDPSQIKYVEPGDYIRADGPDANNGHSAIVWKVEGSTIYVIQSWGGQYNSNTGKYKVNYGTFWGNQNLPTLSDILSHQFVCIWKHPGGTTDGSASYLEKCAMYPTNLTVRTKSTINLKSLPCSWDTDHNSSNLAEIPSGTTFTTTELFRNEIDNYDSCWYKVSYQGKEGYIFSGHTEVSSYRQNNITTSGGNPYPGTIEYGHGYYATWLLTSSALNIDTVRGFIYGSNGQELTDYSGNSIKENIKAKTYQLGSDGRAEPVDGNLKFGNLPGGNYSCEIKVNCLYYYGDSNGNLQAKENWTTPISFSFVKEGDSTPVTPSEGEYAWFPAPQVNLTQLAYESYSHGSQNAIDINPGGNVFAPFTGKIAYVDSNWGYVTLQSLEKVHWANGTYDYMTVGFMHDENISDLYVGKVINQGTAFYQAGGMGNGNPDEYGDHVHITVHKGTVTRGYPYGTGDQFSFEAFYVNEDRTSIVRPGAVASGNTVYNNAPSNYSGLWKTLDAETPTGEGRTIPNGNYIIAYAYDTNYYLDIDGSALPAVEGTNVILQGPRGNSSSACDTWTITYNDDGGFYTIVQYGTNISLHVDGASTSAGANIMVWPYHDSTAQKWYISKNANGSYRITAECSDMSLDITAENISAGTNIEQWTSHDGPAQQWVFIPVDLHVHDKGTYMYYWDAHPHYNVYKCSICGDLWEDRNSSNYLTSCDDCRPGKPSFVNLTGIHEAGKPVIFSWDTTEHTTHYNFWLYKENESGEYEAVDHRYEVNSNFQMILEPGKYKAELQSYDSNHWFSDHHDWVYTTSVPTYFEVQTVYTVTFSANGGTGAPESMTANAGEEVKLPAGAPNRGGFTFLGWAENAEATAASYKPGDNYTTNDDVTLYAVWQQITPDLTLPASLTTIESEAFAGGGFASVLIPPTVKTIVLDAFGDRTDLVIFGTSGSYAETFAGVKNFTFIPAA